MAISTCAKVYVVQIKSLVVNEPVSLTALTPALLLQGNPPVSILLNRPRDWRTHTAHLYSTLPSAFYFSSHQHILSPQLGGKQAEGMDYVGSFPGVGP